MSSQNNIHFQSIYQYSIELYFINIYIDQFRPAKPSFITYFAKVFFHAMKYVFASWIMIHTFGELFY